MVVKKASYVTRRPLKETIILRYEKQNFWIISGLERKSMKLLVLFFDTIFEIASFLPRWKLDQYTLFLICFRTFSVDLFSVFGEHFCERAFKIVIFVSRKFFWRDDKFWEIVFLFLSLFAKVSDFWHKTFAWF